MIKLHPGQEKVNGDHSPNRLVIVGAGWGKTTLAAHRAIELCLSNTPQIVRLYECNMMMVDVCNKRIIEELNDRKISFTFNPYSAAPGFLINNRSRIVVDVLRFPQSTEIILDDALMCSRRVLMMFTPIGWSMYQGNSLENPCIKIPEGIRNMYSSQYARSAFDGDLTDEWDAYKKWFIEKYGHETHLTRSAFNRIASDPYDYLEHRSPKRR